MALTALGGLLCLAAFVCAIIIVIDAFKAEAWKGILAFFCFLYLIYYAITEYNATNKWLILGGYVVCAILGNVLLRIGMASTLATLPR